MFLYVQINNGETDSEASNPEISANDKPEGSGKSECLVISVYLVTFSIHDIFQE